MSSTSMPELPSQPSFLRRHGCLVFLITIVALFVIAVLVAYHLLVSTAMPYRFVASMIQKANPNVHIEGITGDLKTGIGVSSITWGDVPDKPSEILDLRLRYNGVSDAGNTHRIVISDAGVRRAHIDLADFPSGNNVTSTHTTTVTNGSSTTTVSTTTSGGSAVPTVNPFAGSSGAAFPQGIESIEVERVSIEDVLITNRNAADFRLSIPKIEWTGFKATPTSVEPGVLTVESDRLTLHTTPGRTLQVDGKEMAFQKLLTGTAQPALHPAIKQPIAFTVDFSMLPHGQSNPFHLLAADGRLEVTGTADGGGAIHTRDLDLPSFLDAPRLFGNQAADLPSELVLTATAGPGFDEGQGAMKIVGGSFRVGVLTFQIEQVDFTKMVQYDTTVKAVSKTDAGDILWTLPLANFGQEYHPRLAATGLAPTEILARVFAGKPYQELSAEEKQAVDVRVPIYFPPPENESEPK
ncbi:MAG: hypothetical protein ABJF10_02170 [Chthoniobacter sp.]|uniref:hypothetical protein n=1 Tax=Chthoniobacter sp. TaxID=2510640 RepID=UPI0032AA2ACA